MASGRIMMREPETAEYAGAAHIVRSLTEEGYRALLAGGCVRDLLLGHEPKDYDVATDATPQEVERIFGKTRAVGKQFGVMVVVLDGRDYEVATFRAESDYTDGRRPGLVRFTGPREDALRRDFTINGMFWDPVRRRVIDFVGGQQDLADGLVRAIGDPAERFREDHLRIIRAVRFAARFQFEIERRTKETIRSVAPLIKGVAAERLQQELRAILTDRRPALALRIMDELGILAELFPEIEQTRGCEQPENYHPEGDVFVHSILSVEKLGEYPEFALALAALLHDVGKPEASRRSGPKMFPEHSRIGEQMTREICRRLRLPKGETERICWLVRRHMYFKDAPRMKQSTLKKLFAEPGFEQLAELSRADALASWGNLDDYEYVMAKRRNMPPEKVEPPHLVNGHDLIRRGYRPGPAFKEILSRVRDSQLDGEIATREEALVLAEKIASAIAAPRAESSR